jgi:hypothetical protein
MRYFKEVVSAHADESVTKWVDFFILHKSSKPEQTSSHSRRIRNIPICVPILPHERSRRASAELRGPTFAMTARGPTMHAERLILQTDAEGNLEGLPKLPANQRVEAVLLFLDAWDENPKQRRPPPELKGCVRRSAESFEPSMSDDEAEASLERTVRQIGGDPEAFR